MKIKSLETLEKQLLDNYLRSLIDLYVSHFCRRVDSEKSSRMALWVRSTVQREAFALSMIRARIVNQVYSASDVSDLISVSRQAVYQMIKDSLPEGWLRVYCDDQEVDPTEIDYCKGVLKYCAGDEMLEMGRKFVCNHMSKMDETLLNQNWDDLLALQKLKQPLIEAENKPKSANAL